MTPSKTPDRNALSLPADPHLFWPLGVHRPLPQHAPMSIKWEVGGRDELLTSESELRKEKHEC